MTQSTIIIGPGSWGKSLAYICHKANPSSSIALVKKEETIIKSLPDKLSNIPQISLCHNLKHIIQKNSCVIIATPSAAVKSILTDLKKYGHEGSILCTAKGFIEDKYVLYPHELYEKIHTKSQSFSYLYGPTFAEEVLLDYPAQAILASSDQKNINLWQDILHSCNFQTLSSTDLKGMAWCSVFKNIVAIVSGCMNACSLGHNAQALLITHATIELENLIKKIKGDPKTALSLAGIGDIVLSATSTISRNFQYGQSIALGLVKKNTTIEGKENLQLMIKKLRDLKQEKPTIMELAEQCIAHPQKSKQQIIHWLQQKANN